jgi:tetratricopeptide (TPR) repeat protein
MTLALAATLLAQGDRAAALHVVEVAAAHMRAPQELLAVARFFIQARAYAEALRAYVRAWCASPRSAGDIRVAILTERALIHRYLGDPESARLDYTEALAIDPAAAGALKGLSEMGFLADPASALAALRQVAPDSPAAALIHFALSKCFHDLNRYQDSWRHLEIANQIERTRVQYDAELDRALMTAIQTSFSDIELFDETAREESPIFILGLPRTGTTLLERILSNHPQVECGGELTAMPQALAHHGGVGAKATARELLRASGDDIARGYLTIARAMDVTSHCWTDKQCLNFLYCPLLLRAFPRAHLIGIDRHPLASIYAIYRSRFPGDNYPFAYDLQELAGFFIARKRLMEHWRQVLPGRVLKVTYEDLIEHFGPTVLSTLGNLKLPFDERCLKFQGNTAPVLTMSAEAVREPLYRSSLDTWRCYSKELEPARRALEAAGIDCG